MAKKPTKREREWRKFLKAKRGLKRLLDRLAKKQRGKK